MPGQLLLLQPSFSELGPSTEQSSPPCWGGGLVQVRYLERVPPPQVTVQEFHCPQEL